jgi:hypothetical protein
MTMTMTMTMTTTLLLLLLVHLLPSAQEQLPKIVIIMMMIGVNKRE